MAEILEDPVRQVVPPWRNFYQTTSKGELAAAVTKPSAHVFTDELVADVIADWRDSPGLSTASDLVSASMTLGRFEVAADAAAFVLEAASVPEAARGIASAYLAGGLPHHKLRSVPASSASVVTALPLMEQLCGEVRRTRSRLIGYPRNPILWTNLARLYTALGEADKASRSMLVGLSLAPTSRFVVRSAARFFLHQGEPDRSHRLLAGCPRVQSDPWILAAEIATAAAAGKTSKHLKLGRRLLDAKALPPFHLSELASAIGTIEAVSGSTKTARKLIDFSLLQPADNSVAQAAWLSRQGVGIFAPQELSQASFEANAWGAFNSGKWAAALESAQNWLADQPFSSRPAKIGFFVSGVVMTDYAKAESFCQLGVLGNRGDFSPLNNLAFALAMQDRPEDAARVFRQINQGGLPHLNRATLLATSGLIEYRSGRPDSGRVRYRAAIDLAGRHRDPREQLARIYLAFEELRAGADGADSAKAAALDQAAGLLQTFPFYGPLVERLRTYRPARQPGQ